MTDMGKIHADPHDTEVEAAERVGVQLRQRQQEVLDILTEYGPKTDDQIRRLLRLKHGYTPSKSGPATRRGELVEAGLVRKSRNAAGVVVKDASDLGGNMTVWEAIPEDERVPAAERGPSAAVRLAAVRSAVARHQDHTIDLGAFYDAVVKATA